MAQATYEGRERRRLPRIELTGAALLASKRDARQAFTAVLDNINRMGAGFHAKEPLASSEPVTVTLVFLNQAGEEEKERVSGRIAWARDYERGVLLGVMWDQPVTRASHPRLGAYLDETGGDED